jgi:hypothetical protein
VFAICAVLLISTCTTRAALQHVLKLSNDTQIALAVNSSSLLLAPVNISSEADMQSTSSSITQQWHQFLTQSNYSSEEVFECVSCQSLLAIFKMVANGIGVKKTEDALLAVCPAFNSRLPQEVCEGLIRQQALPVAEMFTSTEFDPLGHQGQLFCYSVLGMCPKPDVQPYQVTFPKPRPTKVKRPRRSGKTFKALHLSDWHVSPFPVHPVHPVHPVQVRL